MSEAKAEHWADYLDPPKYVKAFQLRGKDAIVTIARVEKAVVSMGTKKNAKALIYLENKETPIVAGVTILKTIAAMHGGAPSKWAGKRITIYGTTTACSEGTVECIRVRPVAPATKAAAATTQTPAEQLADEESAKNDQP